MNNLYAKNREILTEDETISRFKHEFREFLKDIFVIHNLSLIEAKNESGVLVNCPGVYVHWRADLGVIKVGKSQSNAKSRAFEHLRDNTRNKSFEMKTLKNDSDARLLLFNVPKDEDIHWILSAEAFLEKALDPLIPSGRIG